MSHIPPILVCTALVLHAASAAFAQQPAPDVDLVEAARQGDVERVKQLLDAGVDVNTRGRFGITAVWQAASKGHTELLRLLVDRGADVNLPDTIWHVTPLMLTSDSEEIALLIEHGAKGVEGKLNQAALSGDTEVVRAVLSAADLAPQILAQAQAHAEIGEHAEIIDQIQSAARGVLPELPSIPDAELASYAGQYVSDRFQEAEFITRDGRLFIKYEQGSERPLVPIGGSTFALGAARYRFEQHGPNVTALSVEDLFSTRRYVPREDAPPDPGNDARQPSSLPDDPRVLASDRWPSFRGIESRGLAVGQHLPDEWNVEEGRNVLWRTPIAGLGNSCPVVWDNRIFVTTAISEAGSDDLRIGLYGDIEAVEDESNHSWGLLCLDKRSGDVVWERTVHEGIPPVKRHLKSTQANSTPATDGRHVVALFNFGGLYCYDYDGNLLWSKDLGVLDSGAFHDRDYQWGFGSSPVIYRDLVIVQCDLQEDSFIAAYDLHSGAEIWKQRRDEVPSWATPTVYESPQGPLVLTNATNSARGYDALSGRERWRLSGNAAIAVPTPQVAYDLAFITSGYRPIQPIFAVRLDAAGDISLATGEESNAGIAWSHDRGGPYLPTPILYGGYLYTCANNGILTCYEAKSGAQVYRKRVSRGAATSFTASPVAADGRIYLTAESGDVLVVQAGPEFEVLAENSLGEPCLATPAIAGGTFLARTQKHLVAIGSK